MKGYAVPHIKDGYEIALEQLKFSIYIIHVQLQILFQSNLRMSSTFIEFDFYHIN